MNPIDEAAAFLTLAKLQEQRATEARIAAEQALIALMPSKDEGSVTLAGNSYKASITYGVNRTIDAAVVAQLYADPNLRWGAERMFPMAPKLDTKELRYFQANEPDAYALLAQAITAKPAKPSVKVEALAVEMREAA